MKLKKILLLMIVAIMVFAFSGCANITCTLDLKEGGKVDVTGSVLYDDNGFSYDNKQIENVKNGFEKSGYEVSDINENGMLGFSIFKEDVDLESLSNIHIKEYNIDIDSKKLADFEYKKGFFYNSYNIKSSVDLTSFNKITSVSDSNGNTITGEELKNLFSRLTLKLIVRTERGAITETNSKLVAENKKTAEWVLIPGMVTDVDVNAITSNIFAVWGTIIILAFVLLVSSVLLIIFTRMYLKRKKECSEE